MLGQHSSLSFCIMSACSVGYGCVWEEVMNWCESLALLQRQFEVGAERSKGLHHYFVEVPDDERDRMAGPDWLAHATGLGSTKAPVGPWSIVQFSSLPGVHPQFLKIEGNRALDGVPEQRILRDGSGQPRAFFQPARLRSSHLCGDAAALDAFGSLASAASRILTGAPTLADHEFADDLLDLFRQPLPGVRYIFGEVPRPPHEFVASGWNAGVLVFRNGILVDLPLSASAPSMEHWLLLLHRLSWRRIAGCPLNGTRFAWLGNFAVPLDGLTQKDLWAGLPDEWQKRCSQIPTTSYYSILGERDRPMDVNLASAFAIQLLLSNCSRKTRLQPHPTADVDYSGQEWHSRKMPEVDSGTLEHVLGCVTPRIVLLTATTIERDSVLKCMVPPEGRERLLRVYHQKNTFFVGLLGVYPVVVCMCEMGSMGRDSAQTVASESLQVWKQSAIIMVGIAFGRDPDRQRIGDVLVADSIISYEPGRIGADKTIPRGPHYLVHPGKVG
jgi:hypothetical protein